MPSLPSKAEFLALAIESYAKADMKIFCPCSTYFGFSIFPKIFSTLFSVDIHIVIAFPFTPEYLDIFHSFQVILKCLQQK